MLTSLLQRDICTASQMAESWPFEWLTFFMPVKNTCTMKIEGGKNLHVQKGSRHSSNQTHPTDDVGYSNVKHLRGGGGLSFLWSDSSNSHSKNLLPDTYCANDIGYTRVRCPWGRLFLNVDECTDYSYSKGRLLESLHSTDPWCRD